MTLIEHIKSSVHAALYEDLGSESFSDSDITAMLISADTHATANIITREACVLAGADWADEVFRQLGGGVALNWHHVDGDQLEANQCFATLTGPARTILTGERTALNFLQMLSGTATTTHYYSAVLEESETKLLDTRKTIPGLRLAQKYAVTCGGGHNHRIGLFDAFLIKENHIAACGSIAKAVSTARKMHPSKKVEVEVESLEQLELALEAQADIIMLDNFDNQQITQAVKLNRNRSKLEVSGNVDLERLKTLADIGVDYVSAGALTKHVKAIDLSLRIKM